MDESKRFISAVDYYFLSEDNQKFKVYEQQKTSFKFDYYKSWFELKATVPYNPYFYVGCKDGTERDVSAYLSRKYFGKVHKLEIFEKEDLDLVIIFIFFSIKTAKNAYKYKILLEKSFNWTQTAVY